MRRKIKQIIAVLKWPDAVVFRSKDDIAQFIATLSPVISGNENVCTCQSCGAKWDGKTGKPLDKGHAEYCAGYRIQQALSVMYPVSL